MALWDLEALRPLSSALAVLETLQPRSFWAYSDLGVSV